MKNEDMNKLFHTQVVASNAKKRIIRQRVSSTKWKSPRGGNKYFVYFRERYDDIYCFVHRGTTIAQLQEDDFFKKEDLKFVTKFKKELENFLKESEKEYNKKITLSNSY